MINLAIGRAPFIDQSQSLNVYMPDPNFAKLSSMHFYSWKSGLKTGMYYLRSRPAVDAIKFTLNVEELLKATEGNDIEKVIKCMDETADKPVIEKKTSVEAKPSTTYIEEPEACINCSG